MQDIRTPKGRKIAVLAHCFLNQNAKPDKRARFPGIADPVLDAVREAGFAIFQMPCPEIPFAGLNRFSQVIQQYDTPNYRTHCASLARMVIDQLEPFFRENYTIIVVGIDGSPSCGIALTGSSGEWKGYPGAVDFGEKYPVTEGSGIFMQELRKELDRRGIAHPPFYGIPLDKFGVDLGGIKDDLAAELRKVSGK